MFFGYLCFVSDDDIRTQISELKMSVLRLGIVVLFPFILERKLRTFTRAPNQQPALCYVFDVRLLSVCSLEIPLPSWAV